MKQEFAALPHSDRPFAAERTVWPDVDLAVGQPEQPDPEQQDLEPQELPRPAETAEGASDELWPPIQAEPLPRSGRWIALTAANAVLLIAAAAAVTLVVQHGQTSQTARTARTSVTAGPARSASPSLPPASQNQLSVDPAAATAPDEATIVASLNRYFGAINNHDYQVYKRQFILVLRSRLSPAGFRAEFGTITDSAEQLHSISVIGVGKVDAFVSFISRQATASGPASPTCTAWSTEFSLARRGTRYLLDAPPQWYQVATSRCP